MKTIVLTGLALFLMLLCFAAGSGENFTKCSVKFSAAVDYVTFVADGTQTLSMSESVATLEYSVNGSVWRELGTAAVTFGGDKGKLQLRGKNTWGTDGATIRFGTDAPVACLGDIRTLVDYENYTAADTEEANFDSLFKGCASLTAAPALPATELAESCYYSMFEGCTRLTAAPELPATRLAEFCYEEMFASCTSLTAAPAFPATELAESCYYSMFEGCTGLTVAPALPATALADGCYERMFAFCTSLTTAPVLPAATLAEWCYSEMFKGCSSLGSITMLATDISAEHCLADWVGGVAQTGTFVKTKGMTSLPVGRSGIPQGWSVQDD